MVTLCIRLTHPTALLLFIGALAQSDEPSTSPQHAPLTNSIGMQLVWVPAGEFQMGSPESEPGRSADETPRPVRIARGFYLGQCEVTQTQFADVMQRNPSAFSPTGDRRAAVEGLETKSFPVESITWAEAVEFCRLLSDLPAERLAGRKYRLPTETQWEYACRAGAASSWSFGDDPAQLVDHAWYGRNAVANRPHAVGTKKPNRWGLHDMHGNVWEWCSDELMADEHARIIRGGSWFSIAASTRSAARRDDPMQATDPDTGFRVALDP